MILNIWSDTTQEKGRMDVERERKREGLRGRVAGGVKMAGNWIILCLIFSSYATKII